MIRATLQNSAIRPLSPVPGSWTEGQELVIEVAQVEDQHRDPEAWSGEIDELAAGIPAEDFDRIDAVLAEADKEAKEYVRRQMGLT